MDYDFLIIGGGICGLVAANSFIDQETSQKNIKRDSVHWAVISAQALRPACSLNSLAIISSFGIKEGASEWAQTLAHARLEFYRKSKLWQLRGVSEIDYQNGEYHEVAHLIEPQEFLTSLKERAANYFSFLDKLVVSVSVDEDSFIVINYQDGTRTRTRELLIANGYGYETLRLDFPLAQKFLDWKSFARRAPGYYLLFSNWDGGDRGYVFELPESQAKIVYRAEDKKLLIGSTTQSGDFLAPDLATLHTYYLEIQKFMQASNRPSLPNISGAQVQGGVRLRGRKKRPFAGPLHQNESIKLRGFLGPYKSGYTLPFTKFS